jgi:MATE family multidrug resistance protein
MSTSAPSHALASSDPVRPAPPAAPPPAPPPATRLPSNSLPASRPGASDFPEVDVRAILALALPMFLNSSIQAVLNLTDTWFIGRISSTAVAAIAAVHWLSLGFLMLFGGVAMGVQTFAAQAYGAGRFRRAGAAAWSGIWASLLMLPAFLLLAWLGPLALARLGLDPEVTALASQFWQPRMAGGVLALLLWATMSYFYGTGQIRTAVLLNLMVAAANAVLNEALMFRLGWGIAGSAWATNGALATGFILSMFVFTQRSLGRRRYAGHLLWRPRLRQIKAMFLIGLPIGAMIAFDILGLAVFQLMMARLGVVEAAATQIVMMLTSLAYMPAVGLGMAGTTLVGQSIGAGDPAWARRLGNRVILMAIVHMGGVGLLLAAAGTWLASLFVAPADPNAQAVMALTATLLWVAACYQLFDGLQLGAGFCLRGAGDTRFPAVMLLVLSWAVFLPLTHVLTFASGQGPIASLPGFGFGAIGGWWAAVVYIMALALALAGRWASRRWMAMRLG